MSTARKKNAKPKSNSRRQAHRAVVGGVRGALRASMGVFALGREEAEAIIGKMVERGEISAPDGHKIIVDLFGLPGKGVRQINEKVGAVLDEGMVLTLNLLNVPTRSELQNLSAKISELAEKVDELSKRADS